MARDPIVAQHLARLERDYGVHLPEAQAWLTKDIARDFNMAMDAQPALVTTSNGGIPAFLTTLVDPDILRILVAPNKAAEILGEVKKGSWLDQTAMFPVVERTGEVSSYGDYSTNSHAGINTVFPQRQSYLYQVIKDYGELEMERAGLARISWASEIDQAAVVILNKFQNLTYFFGVAGLQCYGLLNDPGLPASLTPGTKAGGNANVWVTAGGVVNATANEVYTDVQSMFVQLVNNSGGIIEADSKLVLATPPSSAVALTATNQYGVNVYDLLKKNFPNVRYETAVQYGVLSASNPQGVAGGNLVQLIAENVEGQDSGYCSFNEKLRAHPVIRQLSSFQQKMTQGTWGAVIRQPFAFASMLGV